MKTISLMRQDDGWGSQTGGLLCDFMLPFIGITTAPDWPRRNIRHATPRLGLIYALVNDATWVAKRALVIFLAFLELELPEEYFRPMRPKNVKVIPFPIRLTKSLIDHKISRSICAF